MDAGASIEKSFIPASDGEASEDEPEHAPPPKSADDAETAEPAPKRQKTLQPG